MLGLELVVVLGVCVLASSVASGRLRLAAPVLLVVCGAVLGFVPSLESVSLPPEAVQRRLDVEEVRLSRREVEED